MGKREILLVLSMFLAISSSEGVNEFDYYQVVLQWQPATCSSATLKTVCVQPPEDRYSVHGVWPSLSSGYLPTCSGTPPYDARMILTIQARLDQDWPNVITGQNPQFWSYEWTKHGTCSSAYLNQFHYFNFGLWVYTNYDLQSILYQYGIYPNGQQYTKTVVQNAIYSATGKWPALRCNNNYRTGNMQLHEISLCFSKNGQILIDCPFNVVTCNEYFVWNSWSYSASVAKE
ncbi:ribonuclease MC-like [Momordica charantia]|uniref:Ribonuclease MC-like n=1 Tax=Momordica charantia TaxID=3673 RepID=A0A6J1E0X1_MOMCH|nr:ribonuclease MC-like [Momordica charantia]